MTKIHGKQVRRLVRPGRTGARPVAEALALAALSTLLALGAAGARPVAAAEVVRSQEVPAPGADEAVAVFIREQRFVGSARTMFVYVDAATGEELARFADERSWSWGGVVGAAGGIDTIEQNLAYELALYLERCRGAAGAPAEASATTRTAEPAGNGEGAP